jgi:ABC-2 type transport system permease protein
MELLITSAKPTHLIFGKVLGTGLAGLLQMGALMAAAIVGYRVNEPLWRDNALMQAVFAMPLSIFGYVLLFGVLGFFLYASLYGALGSLVSRSEDVNSVTLPLTLAFIATFIAVITPISAGSVENALIQTLSFVPFTSPLAMFVRITMGEPAAWEIVVSVGILALSAAATAYVAAGIYRVGVLLYGKPPKMKELYRAVRAAR